MTLAELGLKLVSLSEYVVELKSAQTETLEDFMGDFRIKRTAERNIQMIVDCAFDMATEVLFQHRIKVPDKYQTTFLGLEQTGLFSHKLCSHLASVAGMRNYIVHEYDVIDGAIVYANIPNVVKDFTKFVEILRKWLGEQAEFAG